MTHDKKIWDGKHSFSPVSLEDAEKPTQLEMTLDKVVLQEGKEYLSVFLEENREITQSDKSVSTALRNTTPYLWIFGLKSSTPCV